MRQMSLDDLLEHFGEEFTATGNILKKFLTAPKSVKNAILDANSQPIKMETVADLKSFLQTEVDAYQIVIDELDIEAPRFYRVRGNHSVKELEQMVEAQKEELIRLKAGR
jgi:hypothetical protein